MNGYVDDSSRALINISVGNKFGGVFREVTVWIDTAFDGHLVFATSLIEELGLESLVETEAILADGSKVALETFVCFVEWFGEKIAVQVIANEGKFPLLGTGLLEGRVLSIDYVAKKLILN